MDLPWAEVRRLDLNAEELGVSVGRLMERAAKALAKAVEEELGPPKRIPPPAEGAEALFLCGPGNNGGDGLAAAAMLHARGRRVHVLVMGPPDQVRQPGRAWLARLPPDRVQAWSPAAARKASGQVPRVIVDCLLGVGARGPPRPPFDEAIALINRLARRARVVSCDVPSGLGTPVAVRPHRTVTFHARKAGLDKASSGRVTVAPIGIPRAAHAIGAGDLDAGYPRPAWDSHKGQNGIVVVLGGSLPYTGAPHYVAMGAHRTGADLVHCVVPDDSAPATRAYGPAPIVHGAGPGESLTPAALGVLEPLLARATAFVAGPGAGTAPATREALGQALEIAAQRGVPTVVDADALDAVTPALLEAHGARMVLTPHAQEFRDLAGLEPTDRNVQAYARRHGVTVVRKAAVATVSDGLRTRTCSRGHPTLTVGGTGDVLAGAIGALLAKGAPPFEAACAGTYLVKCAGEVAAGMRSYGAVASDIADAIPAVLLRLPD